MPRARSDLAPRASGIRIRPARSKDVPAILAFIRELADYEKLRDECVATPAMLRRWLFGPRPAAEVLIGRVGNQDAGFALFFQSFSTFLGKPGLFLEDLYVTPEARGRGLGRAFLVHLARICKARGYGRLEWNVLDWNKPAVRFYESLGAVAMDEWRLFRTTGPALARLAKGLGPSEGTRRRESTTKVRKDL